MRTIRRPTEDWNKLTYFNTIRMTPDGRLWTSRTRVISEEEALALRAAAQHTYDTRRQVIGQSSKGYMEVIGGTFPPDPEPEKAFWRSPSPNRFFRKRQREGEIVSQPYYNNGSAIIVRKYGAIETKTGSRSSTVKCSEYVTGFHHKDPSVPSIDYYLWHVADDQYINLNVTAFNITLETVKQEPSAPPPISMDAFRSRLLKPVEPDTATVTECLASANSHHMDALTFAAELPRSVFNLFQGFKQIAVALKAAKNREIELTKGFNTRKDRLKKSLQFLLEEYRRKYATANRKQKQRLDDRLKRDRRRIIQEIDRLTSEFLSAVANVWLMFRYEIMPNVYAAQDVLDVIANSYNDYETSRERLKDTLTWLPFGEQYPVEIQYLQRVVVKQRYEINRDKSARLASTMSANIATTAWELVKRSFILDWFFNIGDFLTASLGYDSSMQRTCTCSEKLEVNEKVVFETGASVTFIAEAYQRITINPEGYLGLCFRPEMNPSRIADAAALLWPTVKRLIINSNKGR